MRLRESRPSLGTGIDGVAMGPAVGWTLKIAAVIALGVFEVYGFALCLAILGAAGRTWATAAGFLLLSPATVTIAPLYAGLAWGDWGPRVVICGGGAASAIAFGLGSRLAGGDTSVHDRSSQTRSSGQWRQLRFKADATMAVPGPTNGERPLRGPRGPRQS